MTTSLSNPARSARPVGGFDEDPYSGDTPDEARLRGLTHQQLADRLNWLSWYQPGIFAAVMDYGQFSDDLAADTDPTNPSPDLDLDPDPDPTPTRTSAAPRTRPRCGGRCGSDIGIILKFGLQWRHYRGGDTLGQAEIF